MTDAGVKPDIDSMSDQTRLLESSVLLTPGITDCSNSSEPVKAPPTTATNSTPPIFGQFFKQNIIDVMMTEMKRA